MAARIDDLGFAIIVSPAPDDRSRALLAQRIANKMGVPVRIGEHDIASRDAIAFTYRPIDEMEPDQQIAKVKSGEGVSFTLQPFLSN
jgi:hypothetical protein